MPDVTKLIDDYTHNRTIKVALDISKLAITVEKDVADCMKL